MRKIHYLFCFCLLFSCKQDVLNKKETTNSDLEKLDELGDFASMSNVKISSDFENWLNTNGYSSYNFTRNDISGGSFGGKKNASQLIKKQPVIFIHGNGDKATGTVFGQNGWIKSINYFKSKGYTNAELYATTWGDAKLANAAQKYHSKAYLLYVRKFIEAVLAYTDADKIDIISHSMGVTLTRKAIKGGLAFDDVENDFFDLGSPLTNKIDAFVGIAGANIGLTSCYLTGGNTPTCNNKNGFYPGISSTNGLSEFLAELNQTAHFEGDYVYSIWSLVDEVVCCGCLVYGQNTCKINGQNGERSFVSYPYGHFGLKDYTTSIQYKMVVNHKTN
jgi:hypothetical protein